MTDESEPEYVLRADAMSDLETMGKRQSYWLGRALKAEADLERVRQHNLDSESAMFDELERLRARIAELESENAGLAAAAEMAHDDVISLLDTRPDNAS